MPAANQGCPLIGNHIKHFNSDKWCFQVVLGSSSEDLEVNNRVESLGSFNFNPGKKLSKFSSEQNMILCDIEVPNKLLKLSDFLGSFERFRWSDWRLTRGSNSPT